MLGLYLLFFRKRQRNEEKTLSMTMTGQALYFIMTLPRLTKGAVVSFHAECFSFAAICFVPQNPTSLARSVVGAGVQIIILRAAPPPF